jgi:MFS family permease
MLSNRWLMLFVLFVARTAIAFQFQTVGSVGPILVVTLAIDYAVVGTLIGLYMFPGVVFSLVGGALGQRFGAKRIVLLGLALMAVGGVLTAANSFALVLGGRLVSGVGAVLINVMMTKMVADWFAGREIVTAMALFIASWPLGLAIGLVAFPLLATAYSVGAVMYAAAAAALLCLLLVAALYRDPSEITAAAPLEPRMNRFGAEFVLVSIGGLIWGTYNVGYIVLVSFLPELFVARGYSLIEAGQVVSLLGWVLIPSVPLTGFLAERFGRSDFLMMSSLAVVASAAAALAFIDAPRVIFGCIVLVIGLPAGLIMALPAQVLSPANRATGMGIFYSWYYAAMAFLPALAGKARDLSGSASTGAVFSAGMMVIAMLSLVAFRLAQSPSAARA